MLTRTGRDLPILEVTKDDYIVPSGEEHLVHARIEVKKFNGETGERQSKPRIQKFGATSFKASIEKNLKKQGFTIDILHYPSDFVKGQNATPKQTVEAPRATPEQVEQSVIDAAVQQALKEQQEGEQARIDAAVAKALKAQKEDKK